LVCFAATVLLNGSDPGRVRVEGEEVTTRGGTPSNGVIIFGETTVEVGDTFSVMWSGQRLLLPFPNLPHGHDNRWLCRYWLYGLSPEEPRGAADSLIGITNSATERPPSGGILFVLPSNVDRLG
jgi:hypothetical protein